MYVSPNVAIPLPGILTYTKCMLVYTSNLTSHISFVSDNFITWQFTQQPFPLNTHTFSNSHFTSVIYIKSWNLSTRYMCNSPTCNRSSTRAPLLLLLHHTCGPSCQSQVHLINFPHSRICFIITISTTNKSFFQSFLNILHFSHFTQ
jgi:microcystin-dependent protein